MFLSLLLLFALAEVALAQSGDGYNLIKSKVAGGGGTTTGGGYNLLGTMGQHDAGTMSGGGYSLTGGFAVSPFVLEPLLADPPNDRLKNRYISLKPNNPGQPVKLKVTLTASLPHPGSVGDSWWVQVPIVADASGPKPLLAAGECAALLGPEITAAEIDWDAAGCQVLHVTGCPIEPTSDYDVQAVAGANESDPLTVATILQPGGGKFWGDTVGFFNGVEWTPPNLTTNIDDAVAIIKTWQGGPVVAPVGNVAHLSVADVDPGEINLVTNFNDVFIVILAFQGNQYPFGPANADGNCP